MILVTYIDITGFENGGFACMLKYTKFMDMKG
jgi:hypothetical protein